MNLKADANASALGYLLVNVWYPIDDVPPSPSIYVIAIYLTSCNNESSRRNTSKDWWYHIIGSCAETSPLISPFSPCLSKLRDGDVCSSGCHGRRRQDPSGKDGVGTRFTNNPGEGRDLAASVVVLLSYTQIHTHHQSLVYGSDVEFPHCTHHLHSWSAGNHGSPNTKDTEFPHCTPHSLASQGRRQARTAFESFFLSTAVTRRYILSPHRPPPTYDTHVELSMTVTR